MEKEQRRIRKYIVCSRKILILEVVEEMTFTDHLENHFHVTLFLHSKIKFIRNFPRQKIFIPQKLSIFNVTTL